jgi:C-terminal processing protease CtpA/Prc
MRVTSVQEGSPAAQAGVQVGDVITAIAQKKFKGGDDFLDATARAAKQPTYAMDVMRAGKPMKLTVPRAYRPALDEVVVAQVAARAIVSVANPLPPSMADELAKLGKLKADGLLTQAEFDQQKAKLLAR